MADHKLKQFWDSLKGKSVTYIAIALLATVLLVTTASILQGRELLQSQVRQQLSATASLVAENLEAKLRVRYNVITDAAQSLRMDEAAFRERAPAVLQRVAALSALFDSLMLIDSAGRVVAELPVADRVGLDLSDRPYVRRTGTHLTTLVSEPLRTQTGSVPVINFSAPVFDGHQKMIGMLVGSLTLNANALVGGLGNIRFGESGYISVATRDGIILAHPEAGRILEDVDLRNPGMVRALNGFEGTVIASGREGREALYSIRQLDGAPWFVAVVLPTAEAYSAFRRFASTAIWVSLLLLAVLAYLSWRISSRLLAPLGELARQIVARHTGERSDPVSTVGGTEIRHVAETFNSIFDQREATLRRIQEREAFFRTLSENLPLGILQTDILGRVTFLNPAFSRITGIGLDEGLNRNWLDGLHPEDREAVREDWLNALVENRVFQTRFRIRKTDDAIRWVEVVATKIDSEGSVLGYIASVRDITLEQRVQELLEAERRRSNSVLETIAEGVILTELDGSIRYLNPPARRYIACDSQPVIGQCLFEMVEAEVDGRVQTADAVLQLARLENLDIVLRNQRDERWELELTMLRTERADADDQLVFVLRDDSERRRKEEKLTWEATHDALTGLANRRAFTTRLTDQFQRVHQGSGSAALILADLDHFKPVNDAGGHLAGDRLLKELAQTIREQVRQSDTVARLGGDEFALLLPGCTLERAVTLAEAVRAAIAALRITYEGQTYSVTASLGVAVIQATDDSIRTVISHADEACYAAKARGRNAVEVYEPSGSPRSE